MEQLSFVDYEYTLRRKKTRRDTFLEKMNKLLPWEEWAEMVKPHYPTGSRGRKPESIPRMLKMYMLKYWFDLSDLGTEEAIYDSYAMKQFLGIRFTEQEQVPDATTLCKFRKLLKEHCLDLIIYTQAKDILKENKLQIRNGVLVQL